MNDEKNFRLLYQEMKKSAQNVPLISVIVNLKRLQKGEANAERAEKAYLQDVRRKLHTHQRQTSLL